VKVRLAYRKLGKVRFLGHLDMARLWERGLRKAGLPVAMSAGFTPRPKLSFGLALPTGAESLVELLDVTFDQTLDVHALPELLTSALPPGVDVIDADAVAPTSWSLQEDVTATTWVMAVDAPELDLDERVAAVRRSPEIWVERERKGERRRDDVRPGIIDLRVVSFDELSTETTHGLPASWIASVDGTSCRFVEATLTTSGRGVRPTEMAEVLRPGEDPWLTMPRVIRTHQWIGRDDAPRVSARAGKDTSHERRPEFTREPREHESREHEPA
jgi:radical SAM-linked protein